MNGPNGKARQLKETARRPYSFFLDAELVERARQEVGETDVIRSIEAALAAAIDYKAWQQQIAAGGRDVLS
ncbi:MAG: hypothetical protein ACT443_08980 [Gemmatimonadota bacterium]